MIPNEIIEKIGNSTDVIDFKTTPGRVFILISQLQLALRHPSNAGSSAEFTREMITNLMKAIDRDRGNQLLDTTRAKLMDSANTKLQFKHDFDPNEGHTIELTIKCRLGAAPALLRQLVDSSIEPLAQRYDPHWKAQELPVTPPDETENDALEETRILFPPQDQL